MTFVLKVAKSGFNVLTTGNENLSFSSELASHSIYNIVSAVMGVAETNITYTHDLGYIPKVWIFVVDNDGSDFYRRVPLTIEATGEIIDYRISSTTVYIESDTASEKTFKIVVFTRSPNPWLFFLIKTQVK